MRRKIINREMEPCATKVVFPNSNDIEITGGERGRYLCSPYPVALELGAPIIAIGPRKRTSTDRATVPETAINEHCKTDAPEYKVRRPREVGGVQLPTGHSTADERSPQPPLGRTVAGRAHRPHSFASRCTTECIGHNDNDCNAQGSFV